MPHLVKMNKKYSKKGLKLIAVEAQNSSEEDIAKIVKKLKMDFTVARRGSIPVSEGKGIPHLLVFDVDGSILWQGHPSNPEAEKTIKKAVKKVAVAEEEDSGIFAKKKDLVDERDWTNTDGKTLKAALVSVKDGKGSFRRSNGRTFSYDISKLSDADQKLISEKSGAGEEDEDSDEEE